MIKSKGKAKIRVKTTKKAGKSLTAAAVKEVEQSSQSEAEEAVNEDENAQEHAPEPFDDLPSDAELSAGENGEEEGRKGSMVAAMQRILHQSTSTKVCRLGAIMHCVCCVFERFDLFGNLVSGLTKQAPILAKRKTSLMKLHEEEAQRSKETAKARLEKKRRREAQMVIPDASTMIFEKQLRKIATRGGECYLIMFMFFTATVTAGHSPTMHFPSDYVVQRDRTAARTTTASSGQEKPEEYVVCFCSLQFQRRSQPCTIMLLLLRRERRQGSYDKASGEPRLFAAAQGRRAAHNRRREGGAHEEDEATRRGRQRCGTEEVEGAGGGPHDQGWFVAAGLGQERR